MTFGKLLLMGFALAVIMAVIRSFFHGPLADGPDWMKYVEWFLIMLAAIGTSRRLGVINFLEAAVAAVLWFIMSLIFDFLITSQFIGLGMFKNVNIWVGDLVMMVTVFWLHKKRHIHIRRELHGHH
jgi:hypothetical protein